jgi:hypothetical protein
MQVNALNEFVTILQKACPTVELPSNIVQLLLDTMKESDRDRLNDFSFVKPKIDTINKSTLKSVVKLLPFMPDRIDYMIGQGRCCAIEFDSGLFTPCCKACSEGNKYCKGHAEKPTPFGDYAERLVAWNEGLGVGTIEHEVEGKKYTEVTYGEYLLDKKVAPEQVKQALKDAGLAVRLHPHDMQVRPKTKKVRGRPSEKKVQAVTLDGDEEAAEAEPVVVEEKPKRVKLTDEEKKEKAEREAAEKAAKKEKREADKKVIAERREREAIVRAQLKAEKDADRAAASAEKAVAIKNKLKAANPVRSKSPVNEPPPLGTSLDSRDIYYDGELDELTYSKDPESGSEFWLDDERNVYDADKKKIGTVDSEGEVTFL